LACDADAWARNHFFQTKISTFKCLSYFSSKIQQKMFLER
jgi:hypothetical protein